LQTALESNIADMQRQINNLKVENEIIMQENKDKLLSRDLYSKRRNKTKFNTEAYRTLLKSNLEVLNPYFVNVEPYNFNQLFEKFLSTVANTIEVHAPLQKLSRKQRKLQTKPWLTSEILNSIRHKQRLYKSHCLNGTKDEKIYYKRYSIRLTKIKELAKKKYYKHNFFATKIIPEKRGN